MISVPDVKGNSYEEACSILKNAGFETDFGGNEYSKDVDDGKVSRTDPEGKSRAAKGSTVKVYISKGKETVDIPSVVGKSENEATSILEAAGFNVSVDYDYSDKYDEGKVMSQSPNAGQKADKGSTVTIIVSNGSGLVEVPNVVGMTYEAAKAALQSAGFNVATSGSGNKVVSQNPLSGNKIAKGSTITITLGT